MTQSRGVLVARATMNASVKPSVVAAVCDPEWRVHVSVSLAAWASLTFIDNPRKFPLAAGRSGPDIALWHLGSGDDVDDDCVSAVDRLRHLSPGVLLVVYCQVSHAIAPLLLAAGRVGAQRVLVRGSSSLLKGLQDALSSDESRRYSQFVISQLGLPIGSAATALSRSLQHALVGPFTVERLAIDLGVSRRTLAAWLRDAGLPVPERLIGWSRVLAVMQLLEGTSTVNAISRALQFSSHSDLRHLVSRYTGRTPSQLRDSGGVTTALAILRSQINAGRLGTESRSTSIKARSPIHTPGVPIDPLR